MIRLWCAGLMACWTSLPRSNTLNLNSSKCTHETQWIKFTLKWIAQCLRNGYRPGFPGFTSGSGCRRVAKPSRRPRRPWDFCGKLLRLYQVGWAIWDTVTHFWCSFQPTQFSGYPSLAHSILGMSRGWDWSSFKAIKQTPCLGLGHWWCRFNSSIPSLGRGFPLPCHEAQTPGPADAVRILALSSDLAAWEQRTGGPSFLGLCSICLNCLVFFMNTATILAQRKLYGKKIDFPPRSVNLYRFIKVCNSSFSRYRKDSHSLKITKSVRSLVFNHQPTIIWICLKRHVPHSICWFLIIFPI